jgi:pimeloyl-ACP methyl ester carboxylesterase
MPIANSNGTSIYYEQLASGDSPIVMVDGIGEQIGAAAISEELCDLIVGAGLGLVRLDNRDAGLSTEFESAGAPDLDAAVNAAVAGDEVSSAYSLHDMADDVIAVLDALDLDRAHLAGLSLGAYISRWTAIDHPERVASLTLLLAGSGAGLADPGPQAPEQALERFLVAGQPLEKAEHLEFGVEFWRWLWGNGFEFPEAYVRERVGAAYARSYRPIGFQRQLVASFATPGLWEGQRDIRCPTLIVNGDRDPVFPPGHAEAIEDAIPDSKLWLIEGMGHCLPRDIWPELSERIASLTGSTRTG